MSKKIHSLIRTLQETSASRTAALRQRCNQCIQTTVVPYELYELYDWEKFRNCMELYEFYVLLENLSALYKWACST